MAEPQTPPAARRARLFYSYHEADEPLRTQLEVHLATLRRQGGMEGWHARLVSPGMVQEEEAERRLAEAEVILLLLSPDYVASDYCHDVEAQRALERHRREEAWTVPVLVRAVDLHGTPFGQLQSLPSNARPVTLWRNRDEAWLDVVRGIRQAIEGPRTRSAGALEQDEGGAPLYLCSELLGFSVPLRLSLETTAGTHLDRIVRGLSLPAQLDHKGRMGVSFRYQLACEDRALFRGKTLSEQGVSGGDILVLEVRPTLLAATTPAKVEAGGPVYRHDSSADDRDVIGRLRRLVAAAGW